MSKKKDDRFRLQLRLEKLNTDLGEATAKVAWAQDASEPLGSAFRGAHNVCRRFVEGRLTHRPEDRDAYLVALEQRRIAGHAWHPFREELANLLRWQKLVLEELREVRHALERAEKQESKSPRANQPGLF